MANDSLERAIGLMRAGKIEAARGQLELIIKNDRSNILAWQWYARTFPGAKEKVRIWQACLRYNPTSPEAQEALKGLHVDQQKPAQDPVSPPIKAPTVREKRSGPSRWLFLVGIALLAAVAVFAWTSVQNSIPKDPAQYRHLQPVDYYLYVPKAYTGEEEWPLFVGIHGAGANGLQCWQMFQAYAEREGFILLCPSIPGESYGFRLDVGENTVWRAVGDVQSQYRVRPRMFFSGFSAGAFFIQAFTCHYPNAVSGLSILSSGMYVEPSQFPQLIPMVVVIGASDDSRAVQSSRTFVNGLQGYGFDVQYKILPGVGHAVTKEGVDMTMELFRKTMGK